MKSILAIIGKTRGGKDTVATYLKDVYGIPSVCSYTTRAKRDYETDGVEHYFISDEEMSNIVKNEKVIAYVKKPNGVQYCASADCLVDGLTTYIIDPEGIKDLENNIKGSYISVTKLYIECPESLILERAKSTGVDLSTTEKRLEYERLEFDTFFNNKLYDLCICNDSSLNDLKAHVDEIMSIVFPKVRKVQG